MSSFDIVHQDRVVGNLCMFDRMIFKGHLTRLYPPASFGAFLTRQGVLLKDFKPYVQALTATLKAHAQRLAADAGRPYVWLQSSTTRRQGRSKEDLARDIAARDGVVEGLVCVLGVLEPATTFTVRGNRATGQLEVARTSTRCTHLYFYFIDRELGWLHVKLQSWLPLQIQVWVNGHEWLARRLDRAGIAYTRQGNALTSCADLRAAQRLCLAFAHRRWPRLLAALARKVNPLLGAIGRAGGGSYYWVLDQAEVATDTVFGDRAALEAVLPDLFDHATVAVGSEDVMRFLGRKLHGNFVGEVTTDRRRRREGIRVKHTLNRNSIKVYDKANVLRVETTINNPREFKVPRQVDTPDGPTRRWCRMGKGVANTWRYFQCGRTPTPATSTAWRPLSHTVRASARSMPCAAPASATAAATPGSVPLSPTTPPCSLPCSPARTPSLGCATAISSPGCTRTRLATRSSNAAAAPACPARSPNCAATACSPRSKTPACTGPPTTGCAS